MEVIKISDWADDTVDAHVTYRKHQIQFTFRPGAYTGALENTGIRFAEVLAACVTAWNIDAPITVEAIEQLPLGAMRAVYRELVDLATMADLPEAPATSPTG